MRRKFREIVVDAKRFTWSVSRVDAGHLKLRIWRPSKQLIASVMLRFDDPWQNYGALLAAHDAGRSEELGRALELRPITPDEVARVIRAVLVHPNTGKEFEWSREHGLFPR